MPFGLRAWATMRGNLPQAGQILVRHETNTLNRLGRELKTELQHRVRRFTGEEARRIKVLIVGRGLNKFVEVFGELVQHYVDENGLPPGIFAPWGVGTRIYRYAERKSRGFDPQAKPTRRRRPRRRVSHVSTRRPASARAKLRAQGVPEPRAGGGGTGRERGRVNTRPVGQGNNQTPRSQRSIRKDRAIRRLAFLIARSIFERGIRAGRPIARTLEANRDRIIRELAQAFITAVAEINAG